QSTASSAAGVNSESSQCACKRALGAGIAGAASRSGATRIGSVRSGARTVTTIGAGSAGGSVSDATASGAGSATGVGQASWPVASSYGWASGSASGAAASTSGAGSATGSAGAVEFAGESACATDGKLFSCSGGACFSLPTPACGRISSRLPTVASPMGAPSASGAGLTTGSVFGAAASGAGSATGSVSGAAASGAGSATGSVSGAPASSAGSTTGSVSGAAASGMSSATGSVSGAAATSGTSSASGSASGASAPVPGPRSPIGTKSDATPSPSGATSGSGPDTAISASGAATGAASTPATRASFRLYSMIKPGSVPSTNSGVSDLPQPRDRSPPKPVSASSRKAAFTGSCHSSRAASSWKPATVHSPHPSRNSMHAVAWRSQEPLRRSTAAFQRTLVRKGPALPAGTRQPLAPSTLH